MSIVSDTVCCWSCNGTGIELLAPFNTARIDIACSRCKGDGVCPAIMKEWEVEGLKIRKVRQNESKSLREWASLLGVSVAILSQAERGIINPELIPNIEGMRAKNNH